ncbi:ER membrane protein complex subunit 4 [Athene cunicularia]|uniref:ER membrane protein complex subunit 4 n=1 Tax=Athene cunicularia TaxID=194338 RepID=UPI000EF714F3|nr:ER membrane protein complex subunit 4 [Athene cunicularia]
MVFWIGSPQPGALAASPHGPVLPTALKALESSSRRALQGLVFLVGNGLGLALALYKCQAMGLLPTRPSDWLAFVAPPQRMEFTGGGLIL